MAPGRQQPYRYMDGVKRWVDFCLLWGTTGGHHRPRILNTTGQSPPREQRPSNGLHGSPSGNESKSIMSRILVVFEYDERGFVPAAAAAVAGCVEGDGLEVRLRALEAAGLRDITWTDALAFGIDGREACLPARTKRWLDALGFSGWRHLREKAGCVFATRGSGSDSTAACRMVAQAFRSRGMETVTPAELGVPEPPHDDDGTAVGQACARWCERLRMAAPEVAPQTPG